MQDLLAELLWDNVEIAETADRICQNLPGCQEAKAVYDSLAEQVRLAAGAELYDRYFSQLIRYTNYEVRAYYALGLGLRQEIAQTLGV